MGGGRDMKYKTEVTKLNYYNCICMVTAVSGFTEQVSNMVKRILIHQPAFTIDYASRDTELVW